MLNQQITNVSSKMERVNRSTLRQVPKALAIIAACCLTTQAHADSFVGQTVTASFSASDLSSEAGTYKVYTMLTDVATTSCFNAPTKVSGSRMSIFPGSRAVKAACVSNLMDQFINTASKPELAAIHTKLNTEGSSSSVTID